MKTRLKRPSNITLSFMAMVISMTSAMINLSVSDEDASGVLLVIQWVTLVAQIYFLVKYWKEEK